MFVTIFTPTYNRAQTLHRIYESLRAQDFADMEWLIVDDGSTDDTQAVVETFGCDRFPIRYVPSTHGGKHRAYNKALGLAKGQYFFTVDSDDWLPDGTLTMIRDTISQHNIDADIAGLIGLKSSSEGNVFGKRFPQEAVAVNLKELERARCKGERAFILRADIARNYPFPEIGGEIFVTESVVFDRIDKDCKFMPVNKVVTICEYLTNGLTSNIFQMMWQNPVGFMIYHSQRISQSASSLEAARYALRYNSFRAIAGPKALPEYKGRYKTIVKLLQPVGLLGKIYYQLRWRNGSH